jgi:hypothetical protein
MTEEDGFIVAGGGFLVVGIDDVNGDGIPDAMISNYEQWQGNGLSYIVVYPRNVTKPTTSFLPSSQPSSFPSRSPTFIVHDPTNTPTAEERTTDQPSSYGTFPPHLQGTVKPSRAPKTCRPTKPLTCPPTMMTNSPSLSPSRKPVSEPTRRPTFCRITNAPSRSPTRRPGLSAYPTFSPTMIIPADSLSTLLFQEIIIDSEGVYILPSGKVHVIISGEGSFEIRGNDGDGKKIYTILPSHNMITILNFNKKFDQISLIHFPYLYSINDLVYRTNPLQFILSAEQKLILSSLEASDLAEDNFIFQQNTEDQKKPVGLTLSTMISLGILIGCIGLFGCVTKLNQTDDDDDDLYRLKGILKEKNHSVKHVKPENEKELNVKGLSSDSDSLLISSSDSDADDDDNGFSFTDSSIRNEEERELHESENDWDLFSSLNSLFSSDNGEIIYDSGYSRDSFIDDMFNASEAEDHNDGAKKSGQEGELSENDWNLFSPLNRDNDSAVTLEGNLKPVLNVFNVVDPVEEEEQSLVFTESDDQREVEEDDGSSSIDIERQLP